MKINGGPPGLSFILFTAQSVDGCSGSVVRDQYGAGGRPFHLPHWVLLWWGPPVKAEDTVSVSPAWALSPPGERVVMETQ